MGDLRARKRMVGVFLVCWCLGAAGGRGRARPRKTSPAGAGDSVHKKRKPPWLGILSLPQRNGTSGGLVGGGGPAFDGGYHNTFFVGKQSIEDSVLPHTPAPAWRLQAFDCTSKLASL